MTLDHGGFVEFISTFAVTQVPLSIVEGILFYMFATYLINNKPELFESAQKLMSKKKEATA